MSAEFEQRMDREVARWIEDGPDRAPEGLLSTVVTRTAGASQRPGWLARAGGSPAVDVPIGRQPLSPATWTAILLAIVALATVVTVAGSLLLRDRSVVVVPSTSPAPSHGLLPEASAHPRPSLAAAAPPWNEIAIRPELGFEVGYDPTIAHIQQPAHGVAFTLGSCTFSFGDLSGSPCPDLPPTISFDSAPDTDGIEFAIGTTTATIKGTTPEELLASWENAFGVVSHEYPSFAAIVLGGKEPAIQLTNPFVRVVLGHHLDRIFMIAFYGNDPSWIDEFLPHFGFVDPPVAIEGDARDLAVGLRMPMDTTWTVAVDQPETTQITLETGVSFPSGHQPIVSLEIDRIQSWAGLSAVEDDYRRNVAAPDAWRGQADFGEIGTGDLVIGPGFGPIAFLEDRGYVFEVTVAIHEPNVFTPGSKKWTDAEVALRSVLAGASFGALEDQFKFDWEGLHLQLPPVWGAMTAADSGRFGTAGVTGESTLVFIDHPGAQISGAGVTAAAGTPGTAFDITSKGTVSGRSLDALAASIEKVLGIPRDSRTAFRILGVKGYRWAVVPDRFAEVLVGVATFGLHGRQYVLVEDDLFSDSRVNALSEILASLSQASPTG